MLDWAVSSAFVIGLIGLTTVLSLAVTYWVLRARRRLQAGEDPALAELKQRLASGEITPVEYRARLDALRRKD
jgi:uncharacterized membrane protein